MYYLYDVVLSDGSVKFSFAEETKVFGSVNGVIARILRETIPIGKYKELKWKINLDTDLPKIGYSNKAVVIDLKPNTPNNLSLYKIQDIYGYSCCRWIPMMFHLKSIFVDKPGYDEDKNSFDVNIDEMDDVFTFHHVYNGYIENGKIEGKWTPPRPSSTNSALLWGETFDYFVECKRGCA